MNPRFDHFDELLDELMNSANSEYLYDMSTPAGSLRKHNLMRYLELMLAVRPTTMLVGEAPGYRGSSVTGVPFMSCAEASAQPGLITKSHYGDGFLVPQHPEFEWEATSRAIWDVIGSDHAARMPLLWAIFPNHPHAPARTETNRAPTAAECRAGAPIALELASIFGISRIVAVGRKAQQYLNYAGVNAPYVRHPARGGVNIFRASYAEDFKQSGETSNASTNRH